MALVVRKHCSREGSELYCYNTKGDRNSVVDQASFRMDMTRLEQRAYIKIAVLRGRNSRDCTSELVEAVGNNTDACKSVSPQLHYGGNSKYGIQE